MPLRSTCCRASMPTRWLRARADTEALLAQHPRGATAEALRAAVVRRARRGAADACSSARSRTARRCGAACIAGSVLPSGTLGYNKAEVTLGGVDTRGLSSKTHGGHQRARTLLHRRSRRRHRLAGRLQFPVGVGVGLRGRPVRVTRPFRPSRRELNHLFPFQSLAFDLARDLLGRARRCDRAFLAGAASPPAWPTAFTSRLRRSTIAGGVPPRTVT